MFDIGWSEFLIVGAVALVLLGPDELPGLLRTIGRYTGMVRRHAADFRRQFDEAMREAELDKLRREVEEAARSAGNDVREVERSIGAATASSKSSAAPAHPLPRTPAPIPASKPAPTAAPMPTPPVTAAVAPPKPSEPGGPIPSTPAVLPASVAPDPGGA